MRPQRGNSRTTIRTALRLAAALAAVLIAALVTGGTSLAAKPKVVPRPGTYAGIGTAKSGGVKYYLRIGFRIKKGTVDVISLEEAYPGCTGAGSSVSGPLIKRHFDLITNGTSPSFREIKGRFATRTTIDGTMQIVIPPMAVCGTEGTYNYTYSARRYGGA